MTVYSMASMFYMQYTIQPNEEPLQNTIENERLRIIEIKDAPVFKYFSSMGYTFINNSIFDIAEQPKASSSVISQNNPLTNKIFFNRHSFFLTCFYLG